MTRSPSTCPTRPRRRPISDAWPRAAGTPARWGWRAHLREGDGGEGRSFHDGPGRAAGGARLARHRRIALAEAGLSRRHLARARRDPRQDAVTLEAGPRLLPDEDGRHQPGRRSGADLHLDRADPAAARLEGEFRYGQSRAPAKAGAVDGA